MQKFYPQKEAKYKDFLEKRNMSWCPKFLLPPQLGEGTAIDATDAVARIWETIEQLASNETSAELLLRVATCVSAHWYDHSASELAKRDSTLVASCVSLIKDFTRMQVDLCSLCLAFFTVQLPPDALLPPGAENQLEAARGSLDQLQQQREGVIQPLVEKLGGSGDAITRLFEPLISFIHQGCTIAQGLIGKFNTCMMQRAKTLVDSDIACVYNNIPAGWEQWGKDPHDGLFDLAKVIANMPGDTDEAIAKFRALRGALSRSILNLGKIEAGQGYVDGITSLINNLKTCVNAGNAYTTHAMVHGVVTVRAHHMGVDQADTVAYQKLMKDAAPRARDVRNLVQSNGLWDPASRAKAGHLPAIVGESSFEYVHANLAAELDAWAIADQARSDPVAPAVVRRPGQATGAALPLTNG